jgi:hypothetical protein
MRAQSYGSWDSMLNESLVRAAQPRYYLAHGDTASAERAIGEEIRLGFTWTRQLVALLASMSAIALRIRHSAPSCRES